MQGFEGFDLWLSFLAFIVGWLIGMATGRDWGMRVGWHKGYRAAQSFQARKSAAASRPGWN